MEVLNTTRYTMSTEVSFAEALSWKLGKLMPSDKRALGTALKTPAGRSAVMEAIETFVIGWEKADWLEAYSITHVGRWIAKQDADLVRHFSEWASEKHTDARKALLEGIQGTGRN